MVLYLSGETTWHLLTSDENIIESHRYPLNNFQQENFLSANQILNINNYKQMQKWYENRTLLNIFIVLMCASFVAYFFFQWNWGLPLTLCLGTAIMVRGVVKITMQMRSRRRRKEK